jgi:hypothetical protein
MIMKNMLTIVSLIVMVAALSHFKPDLFSFSEKGAFDENGNPEVWVFTIDGCGKTCDLALSILDERTEYTEFNASEERGKQSGHV